MSTVESPPGSSESAPADDLASGPPAGRTTYQRRRRRRLAWTAAALAAVVAGGVIAGVTLSGSGAGKPTFVIAYGQGNVANADSIIQTQPTISSVIDAKLKFVPFNAGVTAIAELRSGALQAISGVGNPPVVGAIGNGTNVVVVLAQSFDADALIVAPTLTSPGQLAGKSVGVLVGSSEDFELRGWLALQGLTSSVKVVGFASEQAAAAAYLAGSVQGAYVQAGPEAQLVAQGGHALVDAQQIAKLGIPGLNVVAVDKKLIDSHRDVVQQYVCAQVAATRAFTGPDADKYLVESAKAQGVPGNLIVPATKNYPFIPLDRQLHWLGQPGDVNSPIVSAYAQTAQFLLGQGRIKSIPSAAVLAQHVDSSFVQKALNGGC
jgi:NitT/TauT family transport system substrate-binding protein